ncbi:neuronal PAS domain-containing protein 4 isoform X1 [Solea senegalensis]|uniref:Neuronal PAS domain-containing protein 4 isoform X1 n=2 Tax=Solea senegalensis TaxID=28829 RepID=A0AAV6SPD6_SOLSE|nr:neuronal PAS domain-containing protein 4A [Solea senegalensis]KAG7518356.1 neuronal PAS domain-containing protein 4 isoform X1 [Solea senegalensis]
MYRSTKGASKARRDQINAEIRNLKDLLPITDADKARLSYLHIMSLACMYTRKSVFFTQEAGTAAGSLEESTQFLSFHELSELVQALPGFLMLLTGEGKLLYMSDSVSEHLGHSMVDLVAQGDSVYDIIDASDSLTMRTNLSTSTSLEIDRLFRCRFNTSKSVRRQSAGNKLVLIRARCLSPPSTSSAAGSYWTSNPVWVCFCSPLEMHPTRSGPGAERELTSTPPLADTNLFLTCFFSQHGRDMRLETAQDSVSAYLGFDVTALRSRSWYSLLHPQDLSHASAQHRSLLREGGEGRAEMVVRVQAQDQSWVWLYMVLQLQPGEFPISSNNYIISESEAWSVRQQLNTEQTQLTLVLTTGTSQQESLSLQSPDTLSSPDQVFTPGSSGLSAQSFDFSTTGCSVGSSDEPGSSAAEPMQVEGDPRSSISSLEEETFFQQHPTESPSAASSPTPVTVETVTDLDFLTQNILLPPSFQLEPPLPSLPLPLPPVPTSEAQQTKEFVCTPPYTPHVSGASFPFGEPLFSFDPTGTTTPPLSATTATATTSLAPSAPSTAPPTTTSSPAPPTTLSTKLPLTLPTLSTDLLFPVEPCSGSLYEKLPPTPDSPGDGDCTVMTLPEVRGPLYVDVPLGPLQCPPEGLLTPEASPGKQPCLSFFSLEREREKERAEISLLAQHISSLAEGFYLDPLLSKLSPPSMSPSSSPPSPFLSPSIETAGVDSVHMPREFYPIKAWRGLDIPMFLDDDDSLFEESILETLLQDDFAPPLPQSPCPSSPSPCTSPVPNPNSPASPQTPVYWHQPSQFEGVGHFCSVQSAQCNSTAGCGATVASEAGVKTVGEGLGEEAMEIEVASSPMSSCSSIPASPPLILTVSPGPATAMPIGSPTPAVSCTQSLLEELAVLEPMFGAGASIAPGLGQQPELYQLQCHPSPQCFHKDGSGSVPPF